ncbi:MAG: NifU family protein [Phycisphaerales bacterium]|nr:NifU family protein [Phycisphaerales bacterium]
MERSANNVRLHPPASGSAQAASGVGTLGVASPPAGPFSQQTMDRVKKVIELIRPAVQADGGDIELVGITDDRLVQIRMHGACVGCPSSSVTLQTGIERNLKTHVPEVRGIVAVD